MRRCCFLPLALWALSGCTAFTGFGGLEVVPDGVDSGRRDAGDGGSPVDSGTPVARDGGDRDTGPLDDAGPPSGGVEVAQLIAGYSHHCLRSKGGEVYCWGSNDKGEAVPGDASLYLPEPTLVPLDRPAVDIATAPDRTWARTCAVLDNGRVSCWGRNRKLLESGGSTLDTPTDLGILDAIDISVGREHQCVILEQDDQVHCWGDGGEGQLGRGDREDGLEPAAVAGITASALSLGDEHSCALLTDQTVRCWGDNIRFEAGRTDGDQGDFLLPGPRLVGTDMMTRMAVNQMSCGADACCIGSSGAIAPGVRCWGNNDWSVLGPTVPRSVLSRRNDSGAAVLAFSGSVTAVSVRTAACAVSSGDVHCWGSTTAGQLGDGVQATDAVRAAPEQVMGLPGDIAFVAVGRLRVCAASADQLFCWGRAVAPNSPGGGDDERSFDAEPAEVAMPMPAQ